MSFVYPFLGSVHVQVEQVSRAVFTLLGRVVFVEFIYERRAIQQVEN